MESPTPVKYKRGQNPISQKNLKPFPPGVNGNPHPGHSLTLALKDALHKSPELRKQLIESLIKGAILREPTPFRELWDRHEGKLQDTKAEITIDNRQLIIIVQDQETKELLERVAERTRVIDAIERQG